MKMGKRRLTCLLAAIMMALFAACGAAQGGAAQSAGSGETQEATPTAAQEKNGEVVILYTSDIHCGVEKGFGVGWLGWRCADARAGRRVMQALRQRIARPVTRGRLSRRRAMQGRRVSIFWQISSIIVV